MTPYEYLSINYIILLLISFFSCLHIYAFIPDKKQIMAPASEGLSVVLCIYFILIIAFFPIGSGGDKERYRDLFNFVFNIQWDKDIAWYYYTLLCKYLFDSTVLYFILTAFIYIYGYFRFVKTYIPSKYTYYFLLTTFGSLGFVSYGVNTMRAGVALSFLLLALSYRRNVFYYYILLFLSVYVHKSMLIPVVAFIITTYINNTRIYICLWCVCVVISFFNLSFISSFIQNIFVDTDVRVMEYLTQTENELYVKSGFRTDFLLYSVIPIITGYYYLFNKEFKSLFYQQFYNVYLVTNSFWLLVIRIPFADRFAYLSWFLYPFIMLYPLLVKKIIPQQYTKIIMIMGGLILFNFVLSVLR